MSLSSFGISIMTMGGAVNNRITRSQMILILVNE